MVVVCLERQVPSSESEVGRSAGPLTTISVFDAAETASKSALASLTQDPA